MDNSKVFIVGANGQLGNALRPLFPGATFVDRDEFDMTDPAAYESVNWKNFDTIINAAAMTNVDGAETSDGKTLADKINGFGVQLLARTATAFDLTLVHVSSDYVFDGTKTPHSEEEAFAPLSNYGKSKADGDKAAITTPKHYIVRTTWVVGRGKNFVATMWGLARRGIKPSVVNDQVGRLTFAEDLAQVIAHLLSVKSPFGTYNFTNDGNVVSWADIARDAYLAAGKSADDVTGVTTEEYYAGKDGIAPRPLGSEMDLTKIKATGFMPRDWQIALDEYLEELKKETA